jgi:hypothetical protein
MDLGDNRAYNTDQLTFGLTGFMIFISLAWPGKAVRIFTM